MCKFTKKKAIHLPVKIIFYTLAGIFSNQPKIIKLNN